MVVAVEVVIMFILLEKSLDNQLKRTGVFLGNRREFSHQIRWLISILCFIDVNAIVTHFY